MLPAHKRMHCMEQDWHLAKDNLLQEVEPDSVSSIGLEQAPGLQHISKGLAHLHSVLGLHIVEFLD